MVTDVKRYPNGYKLASVSGAAIAIAQKCGGYREKNGRYGFWSNEWKSFLAELRKAKISVQW